MIDAFASPATNLLARPLISKLFLQAFCKCSKKDPKTFTLRNVPTANTCESSVVTIPKNNISRALGGITSLKEFTISFMIAFSLLSQVGSSLEIKEVEGSTLLEGFQLAAHVCQHGEYLHCPR